MQNFIRAFSGIKKFIRRNYNLLFLEYYKRIKIRNSKIKFRKNNSVKQERQKIQIKECLLINFSLIIYRIQIMDLCTYRRKFKIVQPITLMRQFYHSSNRKSSNIEYNSKSKCQQQYRPLITSKNCITEKFSNIIRAQTSRDHLDSPLELNYKQFKENYKQKLPLFSTYNQTPTNKKFLQPTLPRKTSYFNQNALRTSYKLERTSQCGLKKISFQTEKSWFKPKIKEYEKENGWKSIQKYRVRNCKNKLARVLGKQNFVAQK